MRRRFTPLQWSIWIGALLALFVIVQVGLVKFAADKLGLSSQGMLTLLFVSLLGSMVNMPLFRLRSSFDPTQWPAELQALLEHTPYRAGETQIAINVGGAVIPISFSVYLFLHHGLPILTVLAAILIVAVVSYRFSRPIPHLGIAMPFLVAPLVAALIALLLASPSHSPAVAYICGTLGVVIGADIFRLPAIRRLAVPVASIGGAGTFDGIFITGFVAVILT